MVVTSPARSWASNSATRISWSFTVRLAIASSLASGLEDDATTGASAGESGIFSCRYCLTHPNILARWSWLPTPRSTLSLWRVMLASCGPSTSAARNASAYPSKQVTSRSDSVPSDANSRPSTRRHRATSSAVHSGSAPRGSAARSSGVRPGTCRGVDVGASENTGVRGLGTTPRPEDEKRSGVIVVSARVLMRPATGVPNPVGTLIAIRQEPSAIRARALRSGLVRRRIRKFTVVPPAVVFRFVLYKYTLLVCLCYG